MTWRNISYSLTIALAAIVVATTASSDVAEQPPAPVVAVMGSPELPPIPERSSRVVLMVVGIGAIALTFRRALANLRQARS